MTQTNTRNRVDAEVIATLAIISCGLSLLVLYSALKASPNIKP